MAPVLLTFQDNIGLIQIAIVVSVFLFGLLTMQTYLCFRTFSRDSKAFRIHVGIIWLFTLGYVICLLVSLYTMTITFFGHPEKLAKLPNSMTAAVLLGVSFIGPMVQSMYIHRIYKLAPRHIGLPLAIIGWLIAAAIAVIGIFITAKAMMLSSLPEFLTGFHTWILVTYASIVILDVSITASLCIMLYRAKQDALRSLSYLLDHIIRWTIQTSLVTSILGVAMILSLVFMPDNFIWIAFYIPIPALIANCFLALLNGRSVLRRMTSGLHILTNDHERGTGGTSLPSFDTAGTTNNSLYFPMKGSALSSKA